jgi:hypothetical protein
MLIALLACIDVQSGSMPKFQPLHNPCGSELARESDKPGDAMSIVLTSSRASSLPQVFGVPATFANTLASCGSWLASDGYPTDDYNPSPSRQKTRNDFRAAQSDFRYRTSMEFHR